MKKTNTLDRMRYQSLLYLKRNSSAILACIGAAGVISTAVSTGIATSKTIQKLSKVKRQKQRDLSRAETIAIAAPVYIPPIVLGVSTILCIAGTSVLDRKNQVSLASAYAIINESYKSYREKLIELHGTEADEEVRDAIIRSRCDFHLISVDIPDGKAAFVEPISGKSIECYEKEIMDAEYHINRNFVLRGYASLNEFYEFLGLPKTEYGDSVGWSCADGYCWIDFEHRPVSNGDGGNSSTYEIVYIFEPDADYMREWR